jgi:hypothetical protein
MGSLRGFGAAATRCAVALGMAVALLVAPAARTQASQALLPVPSLAADAGESGADGLGTLGATLLPSGDDPQKTQLAVSWDGPAGATLSVTFLPEAGAAAPLLAGQALDTGVNLLPLPMRGDAAGILVLRAITSEGVVEQTFDAGALRGDSFFAWEPAFFGPGLDGGASVGGGGGRTAIVWDDGNGPALYVGGGFVTAGPHRVDRIARWDGSGWSPLTGPLGTGISMEGSGNPSVKALAVHDGDLIVAGYFDNAGGVSARNIARWDGTAWHALDDGLSGVIGVEALAVYEGQLFAGGSFTQSGATTVNRIARWSGSEWLPVGTGVTGAEFNQSVYVWTLAVYAGELVVGGNFLDAGGVAVNRIARWNGTTWNTLGAGVAEAANPASTLPSVNALAVLDGDLIVGGNFRQAGGAPAGAVARWNGSSWSALGTGMTGEGNVRVLALAVDGDDLYAAGSFAQADGVTVGNIARWNGAQWTALSGPEGTGVTSAPEDLVVFDGALIVTGVDFGVAGGVIVNSLAKWTGSGWTTLDGEPGSGVIGTVSASTVYNGDLVVAGTVGRAGGIMAHAIARWDGSTWHALHGPFAAGVDSPPGAGVTPGIQALTVFNGDLIAGGRFLDAGGVFVRHIARWDGTRWWPLGPDGSGVDGGGPTPGVRALTVYDGELIAGGVFATAGGVAAANIVRWDGSRWAPLGAGVDSSVESLHVHNGELVAGGNFSQAGGVGAARIARWDGTAWAAFGSGVNNGVLALTSHDGALIAGGNFTQAGGQTVNRIARWDGAAWSALAGASGVGVDGQVLALGVYAGELFAGGRFDHAGGIPVGYVARWNGSEWRPLVGAGGVGASASGGTDVQTLVVADLDGAGSEPAKLVAGGRFHLTGGVTNWNVGVYGPGEPMAVLEISAGTLDFGTVLVGWPAPTQTVTVSSVGSAPVRVNAIPAPSAPFQRVGGTCAEADFELAPLASCTLEYAFAPAAHGSFAQSLRIDAEVDGGDTGFSLVGAGLIERRPPILEVDPSALAATIPENGSGSRPLAIGNLGDSTLDWVLSESQFAGPDGFGDNVAALVVWDDGSGPALYVAGEDDSGFRGVARWDGERWSHLGAGMNGDVNALVVYNDELIAGGNFTHAGGMTVNRVARWNGREWTALQHGVAGSSTVRVNALAVYDGDLVVAGSFDNASGVAANAIARWDGSAWAALGSGLGSQVSALAVHQGELIAGGTFNVGGFSRIARWNGSSWSALGSGLASSVLALGVHDGDLIAGGGFTSAGGQPASRIARWNGSNWSALGSGLNNQVGALVTFEGALFAGGLFTDAGGTPVARVARWDGSTWSPLGAGVAARVSALAVYDDALIVGGQFTSAGGVPADHLARWDGEGWSVLTPAAPVDCTLPDWADVAPAAGSIDGGDSQTLTVGFDADGHAPGPYEGNLCLSSNDPGRPIAVVPLTMTVGGAGALVVEPGTIDFGMVPGGVVAGPAMATLTNSGPTAVQVTAIDAAQAPFQAGGGDCPQPPFTLAPAETCTTGWSFAPTLAGTFGQEVVIASDAGDAILTLAGTGFGAIPAQTVPVGGNGQTAPVGTPFPQPLAVRVIDAHGNPVAGIGVGFSAPTEGPSAALSAPSAVTGGDGVASVTAVANDLVGSYVAHAHGPGGSVPFNLQNVEGDGGPVHGQLIGSGGKAGDSFGDAVAIDGDTAVVGAFLGDPEGVDHNEGAAWVFVRSDAGWSRQVRLAPSDATGGLLFGRAVAIAGDTIVVGAPGGQVDGVRTGAVYVFVREGDGWAQQAKLVADDGALGNEFGRAVAIHGDTVLVGAHSAHIGSENAQGAAYVFMRDGDDWNQIQKLTASDGASFHSFGNAVALDGDVAVIGAHQASFDGNFWGGAAYVFARSGGIWNEQVRLVPVEGAAFDQFGHAVAVSGTTVVVSAAKAGIAGNDARGAAYVFVRDGGTWPQQTRLLAGDGAAGDEFGTGVAVSGDLILVGAALQGSTVGADLDRGAAYLFARVDGLWNEQMRLIAPDGLPGDFYGMAVALGSAAGGAPADRAIIGAPGADVGDQIDQGMAYVIALAEGQLELSPAAVDFGDVPVGGGAPVQTVTATNTGTASASLGTLVIDGDDAAAFLLVTDDCSGALLAPQESCSFGIVFEPAELGPHSAQLAVPSDVPGGPRLLTLSGQSVSEPPQIGLDPESLSATAPARP